jgi:hypothetical protein
MTAGAVPNRYDDLASARDAEQRSSDASQGRQREGEGVGAGRTREVPDAFPGLADRAKSLLASSTSAVRIVKSIVQGDEVARLLAGVALEAVAALRADLELAPPSAEHEWYVGHGTQALVHLDPRQCQRLLVAPSIADHGCGRRTIWPAPAAEASLEFGTGASLEAELRDSAEAAARRAGECGCAVDAALLAQVRDRTLHRISASFT